MVTVATALFGDTLCVRLLTWAYLLAATGKEDSFPHLLWYRVCPPFYLSLLHGIEDFKGVHHSIKSMDTNADEHRERRCIGSTERRTDSLWTHPTQYSPRKPTTCRLTLLAGSWLGLLVVKHAYLSDEVRT